MDHLIFSSSCTAHGQPEVLPVTEDARPGCPVVPMGNTKQICERSCGCGGSAGSFNGVISLRYFNPVGILRTRSASYHCQVPANLMPFITQTAAGLREELKVYGGDYATRTGLPSGIISMADLAAAHRVALERLGERQAGGGIRDQYRHRQGAPLS